MPPPVTCPTTWELAATAPARSWFSRCLAACPASARPPVARLPSRASLGASRPSRSSRRGRQRRSARRPGREGGPRRSGRGRLWVNNAPARGRHKLFLLTGVKEYCDQSFWPPGGLPGRLDPPRRSRHLAPGPWEAFLRRAPHLVGGVGRRRRRLGRLL